ncbi:putative SIR2-like regulatory protein [Janibacter sp. HTCC2649]|uniref:Sir2 family NAD-dependent protein deacetylase n=1 Tax=Janibacter sp. HTCC2649 TaxID=313589 RepID=UPI000066EB90|nr:Sir2 family NAD-dependent protein deacetylase [Janibacter sp. HTCC2649]EAP98537.1 putative SIR2-like regulatory protein [Janibacter sp. HTCC2649]
MSREVSVAEVSELLGQRGPALVLTGAGISTESGIPDYRGPDGNRRVTPMSQQEFVATSGARQRYWARSFIGWQRFTVAEPNAGHRAVTGLQRAGAFGTVITQNVDGLHQDAGTRDVIELHGSLAEVECLTCGERVDRDLVQAFMDDANPGFASLALGLVGDGSQISSQIRPDGDIVLADSAVETFIAPRCLVCRADTLKPDVVFFGGSVPKQRVEQCFALTEAAPALVVLGSSLKVMSGYRFVRRAAAHGIPVVVVTKGPTRADAETTHRIDAPLGVTLSALADEFAVRVN